VTVTIILTACCAALSYFSFRRNRDALLACMLGILIFSAFLAGSLFHPVELTKKRTSLETAVAERVNGFDRSSASLDHQALNDLPNIPVPAVGQIDFVGIRTNKSVSPSRAPRLHSGDEIELRGRVADPLAHQPPSGLFVIVNSSLRPDLSSYREVLWKTAFIIDVPASLLKQGTNQLELGAVAADERGFFKLPDRVTVVVTER
jgi:hypothetical protein